MVHFRSSAEQGAALAETLGGHYVRADLSDDAQAERLVADRVATTGRLDVLVNNASPAPPPAPAHEIVSRLTIAP